MKFCPKCGNKLPEGVKFCPGCGNAVAAPAAPVAPAPVQQPVQAQPVQQPVQQPTQPQQPVYQQPQVQTAAPVYTQPAPPKKKSGINWKVLMILLIVGALIIGAGAAVIVDIVDDGEFNLFGLLDSDSSENDDDDDDDDDGDNEDKDPTGESGSTDSTENTGTAVTPNPPAVVVAKVDFTVGALTITLDSRFVEEVNYEDYAYYLSEKENIECNITCYGENSSLDDLYDFAKMLQEDLSQNNIASRISEEGGITYLIATHDGTTIFAPVYVSNDVFWLVQFACDEDAYDGLEERFMEYAKSVQIVATEKVNNNNVFVDEFSMTLDIRFQEKTMAGWTSYYEANDMIVLLLKESIDSVSSLLTDVSPEGYADVWVTSNNLNTQPYYEGNLLCVNYQASGFEYVAVIYMSEDNFWLMQFACMPDDLDSLYGEMMEIAESVIIE